MSRHPDVGTPIEPVIATRPHITRPRGNRDDLAAHRRRWANPHDNLSLHDANRKQQSQRYGS